MFKFKKEQKTCEIGGIKIGGENPIVLIGTIFYHEEKNRGDLNEARKRIEKALELSEKHGIPFIPDIYLEKGDDTTLIDFISSFNLPFCIDSTEWQIRIAALKHCKEAGLIDKAIYNSINFGMTEEEREQIKELKPKNAILLAFNPIDNSVRGKVDYIKNKLLPFSKVAKVENALVDSGVMPIGNGSLNSIKAVIALKSELGLPTGNGIHNLASDWLNKCEKEVKRICDSSLAATQALLGADFLLYGPIESSWRIFPVVKLMRKILSDEK